MWVRCCGVAALRWFVSAWPCGRVVGLPLAKRAALREVSTAACAAPRPLPIPQSESPQEKQSRPPRRSWRVPANATQGVWERHTWAAPQRGGGGGRSSTGASQGPRCQRGSGWMADRPRSSGWEERTRRGGVRASDQAVPSALPRDRWDRERHKWAQDSGFGPTQSRVAMHACATTEGGGAGTPTYRCQGEPSASAAGWPLITSRPYPDLAYIQISPLTRSRALSLAACGAAYTGRGQESERPCAPPH